MDDLPGTLASAILLSTPKCDGVLLRQAGFMFDSVLKMPSSQ